MHTLFNLKSKDCFSWRKRALLFFRVHYCSET